MMCVCFCARAIERFTRERGLLHTACLASEKCVNIYDTCVHTCTRNHWTTVSPHSSTPLVSPAIFFLRSVFGKSPPFLHTHSGLPPSFPPSLVFSKQSSSQWVHAPFGQSQRPWKTQSPRVHKVPDHPLPKTTVLDIFLCTLSIKHALSTAFVNMDMSARTKQLQHVSSGCLCFTAVNASFIWGFTVNHLCNLLSAHFWFAYCNPREAILRWAACRMSRFAYVSTSLNFANLR